MNPITPPETRDIIALLTRTYRISEEEALQWMKRVLTERKVIGVK